MLGFHGISVAPISALDTNNLQFVVDAAAVSVAGQDALFNATFAVSNGAVAIAGQALALTIGLVPVTAGTVEAAGQQVSMIWVGSPRRAMFIRKSTGGKPATLWKGRSN